LSKVEESRALNDTLSQSYGMSLAVTKAHSITCHLTQVNTRRLYLQPEAGTRLTYTN